MAGPLDYFEKYSAWGLGNGESINFWFDNWTGIGPLRDLIHGPLTENELYLTVNQMRRNGNWNFGKISFDIPNEIKTHILATWVNEQRSDTLVCTLAKGNFFDSLTMYKDLWLANHSPNQNVNWKLIWSTQTPEKIKYFLWLIGWERLPTRPLLRSRNIDVPNHCPFCPNEHESILHTLRDCPRAYEFWHMFKFENSFQQKFNGDNLISWIESNLKDNTTFSNIPWCIWFPFCIWRIWVRRNKWVFEKKNIQIEKFWKDTEWLVQEFYFMNHNPSPSTMLLNETSTDSVPEMQVCVDASFSPDTLIAGLAGLCFNRNNQCIGGFVKQVLAQDATAAELKGIYEATAWTHNNRWTEATIFSDSRTAVEGIKGIFPRKDVYSNAYIDCRELIG